MEKTPLDALDETALLSCRSELLTALAEGDYKISRLMGEAQYGFEAGRTLNTAGDQHFIWRLTKGWCIRWRDVFNHKRQVSITYLPGDLIMANSILVAVQRDNFELLTPASLKRVDQAVLFGAAAKDFDIALRLMWQLAEEERHLNDWVVGLAQCSAEERVAAMVLDLEQRLRRLGEAGGPSFALPMRQRVISEYLGLSVVHLSRVVKRLHDEGIAEIRRGKVTVFDREKLVALAERMLGDGSR